MSLLAHQAVMMASVSTGAVVASLIHFESDFTDEMPTPSWTPVSATIDMSTPIQGVGSGLLSHGYIYTADSHAYDFGIGDFTVEMSIVFNSLPSSNAYTLISRYAGTGNGWLFQFRNDSTPRLRFNTNGDGGQFDFPWSPTTGTRYDLAVCRKDGYIRVFVNGVQVGSPQPTGNDMTSLGPYLVVGALYYTVTSAFIQSFDGLVDEVRITPSVGLYDTNYTPIFPLSSTP